MKLDGERMRALREARMLTQDELSRLAGLTQHTVVSAERGRSISPRSARKITEALGAQPKDLLPPKGSAPKSSGREERGATVTSLEDFNLLNLIGEFQERLSHDPDARPEIPGLEVTDLRSAEVYFQKALEEIEEKRRGKSA